MKGCDVGKLFKLREWLTFGDAAQHLSIIFGEDVKVADILQLALDGHLKLSVRFVNHARARRGRVVPIEDAEVFEVPSISEGKSSVKTIRGIHIREGEILELDEEIVTIDGIWDLPLIGSEKLDVEHEYQNLTDGPAVALTCLEGAFVAEQDGTIWQLQDHFSDNEYCRKENLKAPWAHPDNYYPAGGLPRDSVFVVRTSAIQELEAHISETNIEKPIELRERTSLLVIIAALANIAKIDITKPSKAAALIESQSNLMGARVAARTIENHLRRVSEALDNRG